MDNKTNLTGIGTIVVSLVTTLIVLGGGWLLGGSKEAAITPVQQAAITQKVADILIPLLPKAGALTSPALGAWFSVGDIVHDGFSCDFDFTNDATSTICSVGPVTATSSIVSATIRVATEPYANTYTIWKAANPATETTKLAQNLVGAIGAIVATTTNTTLTDGIVGTGSYINFRVSTTTAVNANFNATGRAELILREI